MRLWPVVGYTGAWEKTINCRGCHKVHGGCHLGDHTLFGGESTIQRVGKDYWKNRGQQIGSRHLAERAGSGMLRARYKWVSVPVIFVWRNAQAKITLDGRVTASAALGRCEPRQHFEGECASFQSATEIPGIH
jgi:hypothetical protein